MLWMIVCLVTSCDSQQKIFVLCLFSFVFSQTPAEHTRKNLTIIKVTLFFSITL